MDFLFDFPLFCIFLVLLGLVLTWVLFRKQLHLKRELSEAHIRYGKLFENPFQAMLIIDPKDGLICDANEAASRFYGYSKEEFCQLHIWDLNTLDKEEIFERMAKAKKLKQIVFRFKHRLKNGEVRDVEVHSGPVSFEGKPRLFSIVSDITESRACEKLLINAKMEAESASRAKDELLSVISHEMRSPLNPIIALSEMLIEDEPDTASDKDKRCKLKLIHESGIRLKEIIDDLLQFSKITSGKYIQREEAFDLGELLSSIHRLFPSPSDEVEFTLQNGDFAEFLPLPQGEMLVGDRHIIQHIVSNLVSNACKYTSKGRIVLKYGLRKLTHGEVAVSVEIEDTGIGIPDEFKHRIFEPFSQVDRHFKRSTEGVGLGLAICNKLAKVIDAELHFESEVLKGSRFWIDLKLKRAS